MRIIYIWSVILLLSTQVFAYKDTDDTAIALSFDKNWKTIAIEETKNIKYTIHYNDTDRLQLIDAIIRKPSIPPAQYALNNYQQFQEKNKNCKVSPFVKTSDKTKLWESWKFLYQCAETKRSGIVIYVDADPINFYMIDLSTEGYPFYKITEVMLTKKLSAITQICYKPDKKLNNAQDDLSYCHNI